MTKVVSLQQRRNEGGNRAADKAINAEKHNILNFFPFNNHIILAIPPFQLLNIDGIRYEGQISPKVTMRKDVAS